VHRFILSLVVLFVSFSVFPQDAGSGQCILDDIASLGIGPSLEGGGTTKPTMRWVKISPLKDPRLGPISDRIYKVYCFWIRPSPELYYGVLPDSKCILLCGDTEDLLDESMASGYTFSRFIENLNKLAFQTPCVYRTDHKIIQYVLGAMALYSPEREFRILKAPKDLWKGAEVPKKAPKRRDLSAEEAEQIQPPIVRHLDNDLVEGSFIVWSPLRGWLVKIEFQYGIDGRISVSTKEIAEFVGPWTRELIIVM